MLESGIYSLIFKPDSSKIYVGSAVDLQKRSQNHFSLLRRNAHFNHKLQNYFNKYGPDCFLFYVIQHVLPKDLIIREQYYIDSLQPFFNINPVAGSRFGSKHSNKTKLLISRKLRERPRTYCLQYFRYPIVKVGK